MTNTVSMGNDKSVLIECQELSKSFQNAKAVDGVNLIVRRGEILVIIGYSGCGKTTVLRIIAGFETPTKGNVILNNIKLTSDDVFIAPEKRNIGFVFQEFALFPHLTVKENIEFGLSGNLMFMNFQDVSNPDASFTSNSYMLAVAQTFPNRLSMNFGFGLSQNIPSVDSETSFTMLNGKLAYPLKNKKIKIYIGSTLVLGFKSRNHKYDSGENFIDLPDNTSEFNGVWDEGEYFQDKNEIDNRKVSFNVGGQYKISKSQFIGLDIGYVMVSDFAVDVVGSKDYSEIRGKLKYKYTF